MLNIDFVKALRDEYFQARQYDVWSVKATKEDILDFGRMYLMGPMTQSYHSKADTAQQGDTQ